MLTRRLVSVSRCKAWLARAYLFVYLFGWHGGGSDSCSTLLPSWNARWLLAARQHHCRLHQDKV